MLNYLTPKSAVLMMALVKGLRIRIKVLFIASAMYLSSDIRRDTIIFSVKQLGLRLVVLLKIMVLPMLYQTIDSRQMLKTIPSLNSKHSMNLTFSVQRSTIS